MDMDIDASSLVELCDYSAVEITLEGSYTMTDEEIEEVVLSDLLYYGFGYVEDTDRDTVEEGDVVKVDYTGYLDGEAFDGGSATGAMVEVSDDSGYIDGFVDGLVGAKVGDTLSYEVTFPDTYSYNEDLEGQTTTFEFTVYGIYRSAETLDEAREVITDEEIEELFGDYFSTLDEFIDYETSYIEYYIESNLYSSTVSAIKDYMVENCTVTVPEDYLDARVTEYLIMYESDNLVDDYEDYDLETYLSEVYGIELEDAMDSWTATEETQICYELIFTAIAEAEGIELDEDGYETFISNIVDSDSYDFDSEDDLYSYYGAGDTENGEEYMRLLYVMNKAIDVVYENCNVTIVDDEDETEEATEDVEGTEAATEEVTE